MSHRWVHYPSLPPSFQETKQQVQHTPVTTLLQQIVHKVILNWRKMERTNSVKCPVVHMNVLHCNIPAAFPAAGVAEGQEAAAVECVCTGTVRCKACDFPRGNQAIRVQGRPYDCWKLLHVKVHVHKKLATEEKVNSKTYCGGRAVSIVQILKGTEVCWHYPKITSQASYSDELLQTLSIKLILCQ